MAGHRDLRADRWFELSLEDQLGNVGSEVGRAARHSPTHPELAESAFGRALELLDLTLSDRRWHGRLREIARAREVLCDAMDGGGTYATTLADMEAYFMPFAIMARTRTLEARRLAAITPTEDSNA